MDLRDILVAVARALAGSVPRAEVAAQARGVLLSLAQGERSAVAVPGEAAIRAWLTQRDLDALYQELQAVKLEEQGGAWTVQAGRQAHRASGVYYTGAPVVAYMVARARQYQPGAAAIIDPACGTGAFLEGARIAFPGAERLVGIDLDEQALRLAGGRVPEGEYYHQDALLGTVPGGFDLCLGNPPYISHGLKGAANVSREIAGPLAARYPHSAAYKLSTYPLFVERGLELVRPGGVVGFILPDSFLTGRYFAVLRRLLLRHTLLELTLITQDFWRYGRVGQSVILFVRKEPPAAGHRVHIGVAGKVGSLDRAPADLVAQAEIAWGEHHRFRLIVRSEDRQLAARMEAAGDRTVLGALLRPYSGLIGWHGQASLLAVGEGAETPVGRLLRSGRELGRYRIEWAGARVLLEPERIKSGGKLQFYRNPKLLLRQTGDALRGAYDETGLYCLNNIHLLVPRAPDTPLRALLAFINSAPLNWYYQAVTMEAGRTYAQVDQDLLSELPLPALSPYQAAVLDDLVRRREKAASKNEAARLDERIDTIVRASYGLDP